MHILGHSLNSSFRIKQPRSKLRGIVEAQNNLSWRSSSNFWSSPPWFSHIWLSFARHRACPPCLQSNHHSKTFLPKAVSEPVGNSSKPLSLSNSWLVLQPSLILYIEPDWTNRFIWSRSVPISKQLFFSSSSTRLSMTARRYFAGKTKWYSKILTSMALVDQFAHAFLYAASSGE